MVENLKYVADDGNVLEYMVDGVGKNLTFEAVHEYWDYATEDDFEGGRAYVYDHLILGFMTGASGQAGLVFVWDTNAERMVHVSEASYTIAAAMDGDYIYLLQGVSNFTTKFHFCIGKIPVGTMDAWKEPELVEYDIPCSADDYDGNMENINIEVENGSLRIKLNGISYVVK